jgi:sialate O-acetylesterase
MKYFLVVLVTILLSLPASAKIKLPRLVSDGMILQRDEPISVWGWADPGETVKIEFLGKLYQIKPDRQGNWSATLAAVPAGGPYTMKLNEIVISNILIGDVWLCSGQSNMELPIRRVMDLYEQEVRQVNNPNIRMFRCSSRNDFPNPQPDYKDGTWLPATQENIMNYPALPYFFAAELHQKYNVPVGLIMTAIGGSPAESWLSEAPASKYLDPWLVAQTRLDSVNARKKQEGIARFNFFEELNRNDPGVGKWSKYNVDITGWPVISLPGYWNDKGVDLKTGSIWFYKEFYIDSLTSQPAVLRLGRVIDSDSAFINGHFVGTISYQYPPRIYPVPVGVLKPGKNKLMVRVISQGNRGGFVEEKPYELLMGSQVVDLTGEWNYHIGARLNPPANQGGALQFRPGGLYNGLINPATNYSLKGVIWYQGESNTTRGKEYRQLFKDLITDWRTRFSKPEMPFLFVQLANLNLPEKQPVESGLADVRDAQRRALQLPYTGMAVAYDLGEWNDIHPLNKKEIGRRLALEAARIAYNDSMVVSAGPLYESMEIKGNSIILTFSSVGTGLYANNLLNGFQIADADGNFKWAKAVVLSKNKVRVWSESVASPAAVRYAWEDNPEEANLKNKEGLPASPFTTNQ